MEVLANKCLGKERYLKLSIPLKHPPAGLALPSPAPGPPVSQEAILGLSPMQAEAFAGSDRGPHLPGVLVVSSAISEG